jgi:VanZ family protein
VLLVTALMLWPRPPPAIDTGWDKLNHVLAFAGPAFAGLAALPRRAWATVAAGGAALLAWGALLEGAQALVPPRSPSLADLLADALGLLLGGAAYALAARSLRMRPR